MTVPDKLQPLVLAGLTAAFASSTDCLLIASRSQSGLFPSSAAGKAAAQAALDAGWLNVVKTDTRGKSISTFVTLSPSGMDYLFEQTNPKPVIEAVQKQLQQSESTLLAWRDQLQSYLNHIQTMRNKVEQLEIRSSARVSHEKVTVPDWESSIKGYLYHRQRVRPAEDCPLSELYQHARQQVPQLSVGSFHDGIRRLQARHEIALQPWTGSLHELPDPELALMQGHSVAYYASPRN
jgi:hypothetical protein